MQTLSPSDATSAIVWHRIFAISCLLAIAVSVGFAVYYTSRGVIPFWISPGVVVIPFLMPRILWMVLRSFPEGKVEYAPIKFMKLTFALVFGYKVFELPSVVISEEVLRVGQRFTVVYDQRFPRPVHLSSLLVSLVFREETREHSEGDDKVDTKDKIVQERHSGPMAFSNDYIRQEWGFNCPPASIASFSERVNDITRSGTWLIKTRLELSGWPAITNEYAIVVNS